MRVARRQEGFCLLLNRVISLSLTDVGGLLHTIRDAHVLSDVRPRSRLRACKLLDERKFLVVVKRSPSCCEGLWIHVVVETVHGLLVCRHCRFPPGSWTL